MMSTATQVTAPQTGYVTWQPEGGVPIKAWTTQVPAIESQARQQLDNTARMPFVFRHVAVMPDVHWGLGATIGTVVPTLGAIMPAAVGVDIGCGMMAHCTDLTVDDLPDDLMSIRREIERTVPHGWNKRGTVGGFKQPHPRAEPIWEEDLGPRLERIVERHPAIKLHNSLTHLGTLGSGNHFIEVCVDERGRVWIMLHSGSRGVGNRIGQYFIKLAKTEMELQSIALPDPDLAYLTEGTDSFDDFVEAVHWAQDYARANRSLMMANILTAVDRNQELPRPVDRPGIEVVNCHHNYVTRETHFGTEVWITRKGALRARTGDLAIIAGSMGARSYVVRGRGNPESFCSCAHGAGRVMSRNEALRRFTVADLKRETADVQCRKDRAVVDELPSAYKDIDAVMASQTDLVDIVHALRQVVCVKG